MAKIYSLNPGLNLRQVIPEGIYNSSENFVQFLKAYYEWLHTTEMTYDIISGTFLKDEIIIGQTSKSSAAINYIKSTDTFVCIVNSTKPFERFETIVGQTSGATARLTSINDNVLRQANQILPNRDVDKSVDIFSDYLKDELYSAIPASYNGDKRLLAKNIRDFYQAKGHEESYKFFMKLLFNQDIEIAYPGDEILRVSDGKFVKETIIRARIIGDSSSNRIFDMLFKTIKGKTSGAIANVIDVKKLFIGTEFLAEMRLNFVAGEFVAEETIYDLADTSPTPLETTIYGIISSYEIVNGGSGYQVGDILTVNGDGQLASLRIADTYSSGINSIKLVSPGYGYRLRSTTLADNTGTGGSGLNVMVTGISNTYTITVGANTYTVGDVERVSVVNTGNNYFDVPTITLRDDTIYDIGMISEKNVTIVSGGNNYSVGENVRFDYGGYTTQANAEIASVSESGANDYNIYLESGDGTYDKLMLESDDFAKYNRTNIAHSDWTANGAITRIKMTNRGIGYTEANVSSIIISFPDTANGVSANLQVTGIMGGGANVVVDVANNSGGIGSIKRIETVNFGVNYSNANVSTIGVGNEDANIVPIISGSGITTGEWIGDDGKVDYKKIQDSYFYQQYSYVIKSGIEIAKYRELLKKMIHPSGLEVFGEIAIRNNIDLKMKSENTLKVDDVLKLILIFNSQSIDTLEVFKLDDFIEAGGGTFGSTPLNTLVPNTSIQVANTTIQTYKYYTFTSPFGTAVYFEVEKETKIPGSANVNIITKVVTGTGTSFLDYFSNGDDFVTIDRLGSTGAHKFKISTVANNTHMTVSLAPSANIVNAEVYYLSI